MTKQLLLLVLIIISFNCYSQISFEKGYYIDDTNQKTNCLIKNIDWRNNPTEFEYKLSENNESKTATIKSIKEFGIYNISKYVRRIVNIDRSSENINHLSNDRKPIFQEEKLFLKVLVESKASLYQYVDHNIKRFFFNKNNSNIEQLIFKSYKIPNRPNNIIAKNNRFRQQLLVNLKCSNFKISKVENVGYNTNDLIRFFIEYNECHNNELINFKPKRKDLFNLTIRPRINSSSLDINNSGNGAGAGNTNFKNKIGFGFGLEAEFIFSFNKNKWAITFEPTYQSFKSEKTTNVNNVSGGELISNVNYTSIEFPIGLRHYFFLNNNSKIFINAAYVFELSFKSSIDFYRNDGSNIESLDIKGDNLAIGVGYKQNDKYSLEIRYQNRSILGNYAFWNAEYKTLSIIFGYSLF